MGKPYEKKITWTIKNFSSLQCTEICSDQFVVSGCRWHLSTYAKGDKNDNYLSLLLNVANNKSLPSGWSRQARYLLTVVNQDSEKNIQSEELEELFDKSKGYGYASMFPLDEISAKDGGFLVNNELKIVAEVEVLGVIGKLDVTERTSTLTETMDVNGFQLLPSQAKSVTRVFERHPEVASNFLPQNPTLRTAYMSFLVSLVETMCQSTHDLSNNDTSSLYAAIGFMKEEGFELDWLKKKLDEVVEKKEHDEAFESGLQGMEEELRNLKLRCLEMEAFVEKERKKVLSAKSPLSFDDVV